ncbi:MAG: hypothetical protein ACYC1M_11075 [Armatimonadota bacterium]
MKRTILTATVLALLGMTMISITVAQTLPSSFNYQGRLTDTAGTPMPNGNYQMVFSIWDAVMGGNQLWGSGNKTVALNKGLFATSLGPIPTTALPAAQTYLQVQLGTDTPMPRIALGAVPYALRAVELLWPAVASISNANPVLSLTNTGAGPAISAVNTGTGSAGSFKINNTASTNSVLVVNTNGGGVAVHASIDGDGTAVYGLAKRNGFAGYYETTGSTNLTTLIVKNKANGGAAHFDGVAGAANNLTSHTTGSGSAGVFDIVNATSTVPSVLAKTTGSGPAIKATPGTGLAGLFEGVIQTNGFKMATGATNGYVLGSDASGSASWRKDGLALPYTNTTSNASDLFSLINQGTGKAMVLGIDNANSIVPTLHIAGNQKGPNLLVDGQAQIGGFKMTTGASNGYILSSNALGVGTWKPLGSSFTDLTASGNISALNLNVDPDNTNTGVLTSGAIRLGTNSGEGIFSKRTTGGNQYGLELATSFIPRLSITNTGNVGIGANPPLYKLHVKGSQTGNYTSPLTYIENTNTSGNSGPALRLGGSGNSGDGVLNVSNFGTGKIAVFGGTGGEMANIDVDGNMSMAGNLSAKNLPAVCFYFHGGYTSWNHGDTKYLETATVKAPSNGYFLVDATFDYGTDASVYTRSDFRLNLYDATNSGNKLLLRKSTAYLSSFIRLEQQLVINWNQPVSMGQVITFQLEGTYDSGSESSFWHTGSTLRVLFVPNILGQ